MAPPPSDAGAVLRAMRAGGVHLGHVARLARCLGDASLADLAVERNMLAAFAQWGVLAPGDQMALRCALACMPAQQLARL